MVEDRDRIKADVEEQTGRFVRSVNTRKRTVYIGSATAEDVVLTVVLAGNLVELRDPEILYPLFIQCLIEIREDPTETEQDMIGDGYVWANVAMDIAESYYEKHYPEMRGDILDQIQAGISVTSEELINMSQISDDLFTSTPIRVDHFTPADGSGEYDIKEICPAIGLAKEWIKAAREVFQRARQEHPELYQMPATQSQ